MPSGPRWSRDPSEPRSLSRSVSRDQAAMNPASRPGWSRQRYRTMKGVFAVVMGLILLCLASGSAVKAPQRWMPIANRNANRSRLTWRSVGSTWTDLGKTQEPSCYNAGSQGTSPSRSASGYVVQAHVTPQLWRDVPEESPPTLVQTAPQEVER